MHCCHCRWCQRETGSAFVLNAFIEADRVVHIAAEPELVATPSESGGGQDIARCPKCRIAVWSNYGAADFRFVRVGTLDNPDLLPPDVHIFTASKQPWILLPQGTPVKESYYRHEEVWSTESLERLEKVEKMRRDLAQIQSKTSNLEI